jgi:predicted RNA-binding protein with PUA-like domain
VGKARPDPTAFDRKDSHFDPKSNPEKPTWFGVDVAFVETFPHLVALDALREEPKLASMALLSGKRMRLSILPLSKGHFDRIVKMGRA